MITHYNTSYRPECSSFRQLSCCYLLPSNILRRDKFTQSSQQPVTVNCILCSEPRQTDEERISYLFIITENLLQVLCTTRDNWYYFFQTKVCLHFPDSVT